MTTHDIDADAYYRGVAGERIQQLADRLLRLSQEAEVEGAHDAALHLADVATQLLEAGVELAGKRLG
ncbi:MAG: hypothetical protein ACRDYA_15325 [Egibacteraceae bacterium]